MHWTGLACEMCARPPKNARLYMVPAPTKRDPRRQMAICQACKDTRYLFPSELRPRVESSPYLAPIPARDIPY